MLQYQCNIISN